MAQTSENGLRAHRLAEPLTRYRIVHGSISRNKFSKAVRQWKFTVIKSAYRFIVGMVFFELRLPGFV
jgi:hypothetical protein